MTRLPFELQRLYQSPAAAGRPAGDLLADLIDAEGRVRAAMLELARPADWSAVAGIWRGVQSELGLPAPAIAVSGGDAYQLWFSLSEPTLVAEAQAFLEGLRRRYLAVLAPGRIRILPSADAALPATTPPGAWRLPPWQVPGGLWSAFVAPDLAPIFADEPGLDTEPGADGQADLLSGLKSISSADFQTALGLLGGGPAPSPSPSAPAGLRQTDPRQFLLGVMNDDSVALALRIEAAKALLS
jgi:hypothetical protein